MKKEGILILIFLFIIFGANIISAQWSNVTCPKGFRIADNSSCYSLIKDCSVKYVSGIYGQVCVENCDCLSNDINGVCSQIGIRKSGKYCSEIGEWEKQKDYDIGCDNNYECKSYFCNGICSSINSDEDKSNIEDDKINGDFYDKIELSFLFIIIVLNLIILFKKKS